MPNPFSQIMGTPDPATDLAPVKQAPTDPWRAAAGGALHTVAGVVREVSDEATEAGKGLVQDITGQPEITKSDLVTGEAQKKQQAARQQQLEDELFSGMPPPMNPRFQRMAGHASDLAFAPLTGTLTATAGAAVEGATGIPRRVTGDVLSVFVPLGGPAKGAKILEEAAKDTKLTGEAAVRLFRGNVQLQRNVRDMIAAGVKPNLAVAAASRGTKRLLSRVAGMPFSGSAIRGGIDRSAQDVERESGELAQRTGRATTQAEAGERIQKGLERFTASSEEDYSQLSDEAFDTVAKATLRLPERQRGFGVTADILYERAKRLTGNPKGIVSMENTMDALVKLSQKYDNPELRRMFDNTVFSRVMKTIAKKNNRLSWSDARNLRTDIRKLLKDRPEFRGSVTNVEEESLYKALGMDIEAGAYRLGGKKAGDAYSEANRYYAEGMQKIENSLRGLTGKSGDAAYAEVLRMLQSGSRRDLGRVLDIRNSLRPEEWRDFAATVLDHMGLPLPGMRTATNQFSLATFLTNFNKLDTRGAREASRVDSGLKLLFEGAGRRGDYERLRSLATTAGLFKDLRKFENMSHSGEQANLLGEIAAATVAGHFSLVGAVTAMTVGYMGERAMMSEAFVRWLAKLPQKGGVEEIDKAIEELGKAAKSDRSIAPIYHYLAGQFAQATEGAHRLTEDIHGQPPAEKQAPGSPGAPDKSGPNPFTAIMSGKGDAEPKQDAAPKDGKPAADMDTEPAPFTPNDQVAQYLEHHLGFPVVIHSGYRDPKHNRKVGGAEHSQHMKGEAWDFSPQGVSIAQAARQIIDSGMEFDQLEITPTHLHISFDPANRHSVIYGGRELALVNPDHFSPDQMDDMQGGDDDVDWGDVQ